MIRNVLKLGVLGVVAVISMQTSSQVINKLVIEVNNKKPSITDAIIKQQVEVAFKEAEKKIDKVLEEEKVVIEVEEVKMKPPLPEPEPKEVVDESEVVEEEVALEEETNKENAETDVTDILEKVDITQYGELTPEEIEYIGNYLIENYFLHGYVYYTNETDAVRKERKKLAHEMEVYVIQSLGSAFGMITDLSSINGQSLGEMKTKAIGLAEEFTAIYANVGAKGEAFQQIYDEGLKYFEAYITTLGKAETTIKTIEQTTNKMLVLPLMLKSINQDLLPGAIDVLDQGFALKAKTNAIYTEGIDASFLLQPEEVVNIIMNPGIILNQQPKDGEVSPKETKPEGEVAPEETKPEGEGSPEETKPEGEGSPEETKPEGEGSPEETKPEGEGSPQE